MFRPRLFKRKLFASRLFEQFIERRRKKGGMSYELALYYTLLHQAKLAAQKRPARKRRTRRRRKAERMTILALPAAQFPFF